MQPTLVERIRELVRSVQALDEILDVLDLPKGARLKQVAAVEAAETVTTLLDSMN